MCRHALCIDVGTSRIKAAVFTFQGKLLAFDDHSLVDNEYLPLQGLSRILTDKLSRIFSRFCSRFSLACIVISGNGPTLMPISSDGNIIEPVLPWYDEREVRIPGQPSYYLPKALWYYNNYKENAKLRWFLPLPEYIAYTLGAEPVTILPCDAFAPYVWDKDGIAKYQLPIELFPPYAKITESIGRTSVLTNRKFPIPAGIPIYCSGIDYLMCLLGTNTLYAGQVCDRSGTSEGINYCVSRMPDNAKALPHVVPDMYTMATLLPWSGQVLYQLSKLAKEYELSYHSVRDLASVKLSREEQDIIACCTQTEYSQFLSVLKGYPLAERRRHIATMLHHVAYSVREVLDALQEQGYAVHLPIKLCGSQCANPDWLQYKADCIQLPIQVPYVHDAELLGSLCVAMVAMKLFSDLPEASSKLVVFEKIYVPRA